LLKINGKIVERPQHMLMRVAVGIHLNDLDAVIETYQGQYGLIEYKEVNGVDNDASIENIVKYFDNLCKFLAKERQDEKLQMSWLQNDIDNIASLLYSTKYKLVNLQ
jgi:hypothetical protein